LSKEYYLASAGTATAQAPVRIGSRTFNGKSMQSAECEHREKMQLILMNEAKELMLHQCIDITNSSEPYRVVALTTE
jgi:hypothetical protein